MGRSGRGGRGFGRGGRGKGGQNKKNGDPNSKKKDATDKKYIFTLIESTVDVRVSAYETTLKKLYEHLMKEIKNHPEDVVDSLKDKKVKDLDNGQSQTIELLPKDADERKIEEIRMINETHKMVYLQIKQEERRRTEILGSNLRVAYSIIFSSFCDRELQNRLEHRDDFISKVENNPIELLAAIKEMMHTALHEKLTSPMKHCGHHWEPCLS